MSDMTFYTDVRTSFGRFRGTGNWAVLSIDKATKAEPNYWDREKRGKCREWSERLWTRRIKAKPFKLTPASKAKAYVQKSGFWFPYVQVRHVALSVGAIKYAIILAVSKNPTLFLVGPRGRGVVCGMEPVFVKMVGGAKTMRSAKTEL